MKLVIDKNQAHRIAAAAARISSGIKPVLRCVRICARETEATFTATDAHELTLTRTTNQVEVREPGECLVPAAKIAEILGAIGDTVVEMELNDDVVRVSGSAATFRVHTMPIEEFPPVDDAGTAAFSLPAADLAMRLKHVAHAQAKESTKYAISGTLIEASGREANFVATDGKRLAWSTQRLAQPAGPMPANLILPHRALDAVVSACDQWGGESVDVSYEGGRAGFVAESWTIIATTVEGAFPPWRDVIPKDEKLRATLKIAELADALRSAKLMTGDVSKGVQLDFGEILRVAARSDSGDANIAVNCTLEGERFPIAFNPLYILNAITALEAEEITLSLIAPNKPGTIKCGDYLCVIMPVRSQ